MAIGGYPLVEFMEPSLHDIFEASETSHLQPPFVETELQFDSHVGAQCFGEKKQVSRPEDAALLEQGFHLLLEDCARGVACKDQEGSDRTLTRME
jgi:hypothetical protein